MKNWNKLARLTLAVLTIAALLLGTAFAAQTSAVQVVDAGGTVYYNAAGSQVNGATALGQNGAVVKMTKTVEGTDVENEFIVTMQVQTLQDIRQLSSTNPDAALMLVVDVSNSMDDCAVCGQEESNNDHGSRTTTLYCNTTYTSTYEDGRDDGERCDNCNQRERDHIEVITVTLGNGDHQYRGRIEDAISAANQLLLDYAGTATAGSKRYVALVTFGSSAVRRLNWVDVATAQGLATAQAAINGMRVANNDYSSSNKDGGGTNIEAGLMLADNNWDAALASGGVLNGINYQYTLLLTDGNPTFYVSDNDNTRNSLEAIEGRAGGSNETTFDDAVDVGDEAEGIRANSPIAKLYSICFGTKANNNGTTTPVWDTTPFGNWNTWQQRANPATTTSTTVGQWLAAFSSAAYNGSATGLFDAFDSVMNIIQLEARAWRVEDWMGDYIVYGGAVPVSNGQGGSLYNAITTPDAADYTGNTNGTPAYVWNLLQSNTDPSITTMVTNADGTTTGYLGYTYKYKVTLDNLDASYEQGATVPVNKLATLKYVTTDENGNWPSTDSGIKTGTFDKPSVKGLYSRIAFTKLAQDADGNLTSLAGARLRLSPQTFPINSTERWMYVTSVISDDNGQVTFIEPIPSGHKYTLEEIVVPDNYLNPGNQTITVSYGTVSGMTDADNSNTPDLVNHISPDTPAQLTLKKEFAQGSILADSITIRIEGVAGTATEGFLEQAILNDEDSWTETVYGLAPGKYLVTEISAAMDTGALLRDEYGLDYEIWVDGVKVKSANYNDRTQTANKPSWTIELKADDDMTVRFVNDITHRTGVVNVSKHFVGLDSMQTANLSVTVTATPVDQNGTPIAKADGFIYQQTLSAANNWSVTGWKLPIGRYQLTETVNGTLPEGYSFLDSGVMLSGTEVDGGYFTLTETYPGSTSQAAHVNLQLVNEYERDHGHIHIEKYFYGDLTDETFPGNAIDVLVYAAAENGGVPDFTTATPVATIQLDSDSEWHGFSAELPTGTYYLVEVTAANADNSAYVDGYDLVPSWGVDDPDNTADTHTLYRKIEVTKDVHPLAIITNTYHQHKGYIQINKDFGDVLPENERPATIHVHVIQGTTLVDTIQVKKQDNDTYTGLSNALPIGTYTLVEVTTPGAEGTADVDGYAVTPSWPGGSTVTVTKDNTATVPMTVALTNTYTHDLGKLTIRKSFTGLDEQALAALKDTVILVNLYPVDNGQPASTPSHRVELVLDENGQATSTIDLPVDEYLVQEALSPTVDGYTSGVPTLTFDVTATNDVVNIELDQTVNATLVNNYTRDQGYIQVTKKFAGLPENLQPEKIDVYIFKGDTFVEALTLQASNNYTATSKALDVGQYTLYEPMRNNTPNTAFVPGYTVTPSYSTGRTVDVTTAHTTTAPLAVEILNTYEQDVGTLTVAKYFDGVDASLMTGASFQINVKNASGSVVAQLTLTGASTPAWTASVSLPMGTYTLEEATPTGVNDYTWTGVTILPQAVTIQKNATAEIGVTNHYSRNVGYIQVNKMFNLPEGVTPPEEIHVNVMQGGTKVATIVVTKGQNGDYTGVSQALPTGNYTLVEVTDPTMAGTAYLPGYAVAPSWENGTGNVTVTANHTATRPLQVNLGNQYTRDMGYIQVVKTVTGTVNPALLPASIKVNVMYGTQPITQITLTKQADGTYAGISGPVPTGTYTLEEVLDTAYVADYTVAPTWPNGNSVTVTTAHTATAPISISLTNTYTQDMGTLSVSKVFAGALDKDDFATKSITVYVKDLQGSTVQALVLNATNGWAATTDLPVGEYVLEEEGAAVNNYALNASWRGLSEDNTLMVRKDVTSNVTITNTYSANPGSLTITKVLAGDSAGYPAAVTMTVKGNGYQKTVTLNAQNHWTATISDIPAGTYAITENDTATASHKVHTTWSANNAAVTVAPGQAVSITCTNTYEGKVSVKIPVQKTVTLGGGNTLPGENTFAFGLSLSDNTGVTVRYEGALKAATGGYAIALDGEGTATGYIVLEGFAEDLNGLVVKTWETMAPYASAEEAKAAGWTYDDVAWQATVTADSNSIGMKITTADSGMVGMQVSFDNTFALTDEEEIPPTGDDAPLMLWLAMAALSMAGIGFITLRMKKQHN